MRIRRGDNIVIIAGDDAAPGPRRVIQVLDQGRKVRVEGANRVFKHVRRGHPKSPQGGRLNLEMPIDSSNVMLYCESCSKGVRVGVRYADSGAKQRFCKSCGTAVGDIGPPKARAGETSG